jgi:hypothetical protein
MAFPSWPYRTILQTSQQLAGLLDSHEEAERILGPVGPKLAAANLHPWIWNAAVDLWDDGHLREAVQAAAVALFDSHLPAKLGQFRVPAVNGTQRKPAQMVTLRHNQLEARAKPVPRETFHFEHYGAA